MNLGLNLASRWTKESGRTRKNWREVVGMFRDSEFMREVNDECLRMREAEREEARHEGPGE